MPTYTYMCGQCSTKVEITCTVQEMETTEFTHYGADHKMGCLGKMRKLVDAPGVILKGDDWPGKEIKGD